MESSGRKGFEGGRGRTRLLAGMTAVAMTVGLAAVLPSAAQAGQSPKGPDTSVGGKWSDDHKKPVVPKYREKNPKLDKKCGLDVALVVDRSKSITRAPQGMERLKAALTGLVDQLDDSGADVSLISFAATATTDATFRDSTRKVKAAINDLNAAGSTNWAAALREVRDLRDRPDLVLFMTDGRPNTIPGAGGAPEVPGDFQPVPFDFSQTALEAAVVQANAVKAQRSKIFLVAIGQSDQDGDFGENANRAIAGDRRLQPGGSVRQADYVQLNGFGALQGSLRSLIAGLCTSIDKDSNPDGKVTRGSTISYSVTLKNNGRKDVRDSLVDVLPAGVRYVRGSAEENGPARFAEPRVSTDRRGVQTLTWRSFELEKGERQVFKYKVTVNRNVDRGDRLTNTATWNTLTDSTTNVVKSWTPSKDDHKGDKDKGKKVSAKKK